MSLLFLAIVQIVLPFEGRQITWPGHRVIVQLGIHRAALDSSDAPFGLDSIERMNGVERFLRLGQVRTLMSPICLPMIQTE